MDSRERIERIARLEAEVQRLRLQEDPVLACAICNLTEDEIDFGLTDVTVVVADGEEGYSDVTLLLCGDDLETITAALQALGFIDHRHGSTSTLEDILCPGYADMNACPTPTRYGNVIWGRRPPQDPEDE